jgi:hypothetical protein
VEPTYGPTLKEGVPVTDSRFTPHVSAVVLLDEPQPTDRPPLDCTTITCRTT